MDTPPTSMLPKIDHRTLHASSTRNNLLHEPFGIFLHYLKPYHPQSPPSCLPSSPSPHHPSPLYPSPPHPSQPDVSSMADPAPRLKVRICTWNVGNAPPPSDITEWLGLSSPSTSATNSCTDNANANPPPPVYDLIVIGAQEALYGGPERVFSPSIPASTPSSSARSTNPWIHTPTATSSTATTKTKSRTLSPPRATTHQPTLSRWRPTSSRNNQNQQLSSPPTNTQGSNSNPSREHSRKFRLLSRAIRSVRKHRPRLTSAHSTKQNTTDSPAAAVSPSSTLLTPSNITPRGTERPPRTLPPSPSPPSRRRCHTHSPRIAITCVRGQSVPRTLQANIDSYGDQPDDDDCNDADESLDTNTGQSEYEEEYENEEEDEDSFNYTDTEEDYETDNLPRQSLSQSFRSSLQLRRTTSGQILSQKSLRDIDESLLIRNRGDGRVHPPPPLDCLQPIDDPLAIKDAPPSTSAVLTHAPITPTTPSPHHRTANTPRVPPRLPAGFDGVSSSPVCGDGNAYSDVWNVPSPRSTSSSATPSTSSPSRFATVVAQNMGSDYKLVVKGQMMEMQIFVYIHKKHHHRVERNEIVAEATGIANIVGNKGAVVAKVVLDGTSFCFVNSHLAAHEGEKYIRHRNADVVDIMRHIERCGAIGVPIVHWFDHIFWMGDLNYRLDVRRMVPVSATWAWEKRFAYVTHLIRDGRFTDLANCDELRSEMADGRVFVGFAEGALCFAPTFKVERGLGRTMAYQNVRIPAYCDRVLWHSKPMHKGHIKVREYGCIESIDTSDHKPVACVFDVVLPHKVSWLPLPAPIHSYTCTLDFVRMELKGLYTDEGNSFGGGGGNSGTSLGKWSRNGGVSGGDSLRYEVLEDGALQADDDGAVTNGEDDDDGETYEETRHAVTASFLGDDIFVDGRRRRVEVARKGGRRICEYGQLPCIALRPVRKVDDFLYKYVTVVFERAGTRLGSGCVFPLAALVRGGRDSRGRRRIKVELELTKYGARVGAVVLEVEMTVARGGWIDSRARRVTPSRRGG